MAPIPDSPPVRRVPAGTAQSPQRGSVAGRAGSVPRSPATVVPEPEAERPTSAPPVDSAGTHTPELDDVRTMLITGRAREALTTLDRRLTDLTGRLRAQALVLRLAALLNLHVSGEYATTMDQAFAAVRSHPDPGRYGQLEAMAALVTLRENSMERCVTHLVRSSRALNAVTSPDSDVAWAWFNLAMAYSYTGFHGHALGAAEQARKVADELRLPPNAFLATPIRLRLAVALDHRGDSDGCRKVLRDLAREYAERRGTVRLCELRPSALGAYGYAIARLAAMGDPQVLEDTDPAGMLWAGGGSAQVADMRRLADVCLAIAADRPIEGLSRLATVSVDQYTLGAAEPLRLRALALLAAGRYRDAYVADRHAFRIVSAQDQALRDRFIDGLAARLDHEDLSRKADRYAGQANTDPLTGLPNRRSLEQFVADLVAGGHQAVVGVADLDGFKAVNTVHGHHSGDLVLQRIAGVLSRVMRRGDLVARYGGDEFVIVLPRTGMAEAQEIGHRLNHAVAGEDWHALVPGTPVSVTIGWAEVSHAGAATISAAFEEADLKMLRAKTPRPRAV